MSKTKLILIAFFLSSCFFIPNSCFAKDPTYKWTKAVGGAEYDFADSTAVDSQNNAYITGSFYGTFDFDPSSGTDSKNSNGATDMFLSKYDSSGNYQWTRAIGGTDQETGWSVDTDPSDNVYVSGYFQSATIDFDPSSRIDTKTKIGSYDMFLTKFDSDGNYKWTRTVGGTGYMEAVGVSADSSGSLYVTGGFSGTVDFDPGAGIDSKASAGSYDIYLTKYDSAGNYQWTRVVGGTSADGGKAITVDSSDNIYVSGYFSGTADFDPGTGTDSRDSVGSNDIFLTKYNSSGNYQWTKSIGGTGSDRSYSVTTDLTGNVYITGYFSEIVDFDPGTGINSKTSIGGEDVYIAKYNSSGNYQWVETFGSTSNDEGNSLVVDHYGNVYSAGFFQGTVDFDPGAGIDSKASAGSYDIYLTKYDSSGNYQWTKSIGGTGSDRSYSVTTDLTGNVYITGYFSEIVDFDPTSSTDERTSAGSRDIFLTRFNDDTTSPDNNPNEIELTFGSGDSLKKTKTIYLKKKPELSGTIEDAENGTLKIYQRNKNGGKHLIDEISIDQNGNWNYDLKELKKNKTITLYFKTEDDNFNESNYSSPYKVYLDKEDPKLLANKSELITNRSKSITFSATDDETEISYYKLKLIQGNKTIRTWRKQNSTTYQVPSTVKPGSYSLIIRAYDKAGNKAEKRIAVRVR
jgi:hypothetical protein